LAPEALEINSNRLPFADQWGPGIRLQLLMADVAGGFFVIRIKFAPGVQVQTHKHTGAVHAFTLAGEWCYLESPEAKNTAGSYLFEPPGSVHTLKVADHNTEETDGVFVIYGALLFLDAEGKVEGAVDAASHITDWAAALKAENKETPEIIVGSAPLMAKI
jgi:2,4'-dihydroxyacetophenone dioxygenase